MISIWFICYNIYLLIVKSLLDETSLSKLPLHLLSMISFNYVHVFKLATLKYLLK